ncbi:MAG: aldo/keto reductase [Rubrivivax sp.]|nr:aldo/keto reductase [Pyrinomonadaceae bacterium]
MALQGFATTEGTARYRDRLGGIVAENHFRFEQQLWLTSIGVGTYLGGWDEETDRAYAEAVTRAVGLGANVIDTASNYRFQRSERSIGDALREITKRGMFSREEIVVCTKGGYIPFDGEPPKGKAAVRSYVEETFVRSGIAAFEDFAAGGHCMTPRYISHQVGQSLSNMGLETVDVYYVHNPETQLSVVTREEFENRLRAAFEQLEKERAEGRIKYYGVATWNGFRTAPDAKDYHSLERMSELAREVGGEGHGFRFVQLPYNLVMREARDLNNQSYMGAYLSLLEVAQALAVTVVASASIMQGRVARDLPVHIREPLGSLATDAQTAVQFVRSTPGVTTALVGMSRTSHVKENLQLSRVAPVSAETYSRLLLLDVE